MKTLKFLSIGLVFVLLFSNCNNTPKTVTAKPDKTEISGVFSDYLEIVDGEYTLSDKGFSKVSITIKLKAKKKLPDNMPLVSDGIHKPNFNLNLTFLDEKGMPIPGLEDLHLYPYEKFMSLLQTGEGEEFITLTNNISGYKPDEHAKLIKKFTISSFYEEREVSKVVEIKAEDFKLYNDIKSYFKVAEGSYKPVVKKGLIYIEVTFELLKTYTKSVAHNQAFIELIPKNANGGKVKNQSNINFRASSNSDGAEFFNFLKSDPGEKITMEFNAGVEGAFGGDAVKAKELVEDLAKFDVKVDFN